MAAAAPTSLIEITRCNDTMFLELVAELRKLHPKHFGELLEVIGRSYLPSGRMRVNELCLIQSLSTLVSPAWRGESPHRGLREGLREGKLASNMGQIYTSSSWPEIASNIPQEASRRPQDGYMCPRSPPRAPPRNQLAPKPKQSVLYAFTLFASDGCLKPQDGTNMAQESPARGPRGPPEVPKSVQERPMRVPRRPSS